jgi:hypothetical protein
MTEKLIACKCNQFFSLYDHNRKYYHVLLLDDRKIVPLESVFITFAE